MSRMNIRRRLLLLFTLIVIAFNSAIAQVIKGTYAIKNAKTGMLLRIKDANSKDGTPLVAYNPVNWKCMTWDFQQVEGQAYQLMNLFTGKTFQPGATPAENVSLVQQPLAESSPQYEFIKTGEKTYLIRLKGTRLYITPSDKNGSVNSSIILAEKNNDKSQEWIIYEQHPEM